MNESKVAVVGLGYVGTGVLKIFPDAVKYDSKFFAGLHPEAVITRVREDGQLATESMMSLRDHVNACDLAIICVPTPSKEDGSCDVSAVEDVMGWIGTPLVLIKSAVAPGTTDRLQEEYRKGWICASPEYMGESRYRVPDRFLDPRNPLKHEFLILGGPDEACSRIADIFAPRVGPVCRIRIMKATEAELVKYAENAFFSTKIAFAQELRDLCKALGANWHRVREGWIDDPRVGPMHTAVFPRARGFSGKCLPKDLLAIIRAAEQAGVPVPVLRGVLEDNAGRGV